MPFQLTHFQCFYTNMSSKEQEVRGEKKADKQANSQWKPGLSWRAWLVIITMPWICSPTGKHYLAHRAQEKRAGAMFYIPPPLYSMCGYVRLVLGLRCIVSTLWSLINIYLFPYNSSFILLQLFYHRPSFKMTRNRPDVLMFIHISNGNNQHDGL